MKKSYLLLIGFFLGLSHSALATGAVSATIKSVRVLGEASDALDKAVGLNLSISKDFIDEKVDSFLSDTNVSESIKLQLRPSFDYFDFSSPLPGRDTKFYGIGFDLIQDFSLEGVTLLAGLEYSIGILDLKSPQMADSKLQQYFGLNSRVMKKYFESSHIGLELGFGVITDSDYPVYHNHFGVTYEYLF